MDKSSGSDSTPKDKTTSIGCNVSPHTSFTKTPPNKSIDNVRGSSPKTPIGMTPKKRKFDALKETIEGSLTEMELYTGSAIYSLSKKDTQASIEKMEKARRLYTCHGKKSLSLLKELEKDIETAPSSTISYLTQREATLMQQNNQMKARLNVLKIELESVKKERNELNQLVFGALTPSEESGSERQNCNQESAEETKK